ncbi:MAG: hypothetical protein WAW39_10515 [Prosthecobacter sp.]|uniref:hypothetical protein n=1 Tax=Prosthecobacter sp. TaxID=1965333 RepID=UPI003BB1C0CF
MADKTLASLTAASPATGGLIYGTQGGADRKFTLTAAGAAVLESSTTAEQQTALGLGALATQNSITPGSTATSGASAGDLLTSDGSVVQNLTPGAGVNTAIGNAVNDNGGLLTHDIIGTSGAKLPLLSEANTFGQEQSIDVVSGRLLTLKLAGTDYTYITDEGLFLGMPGVSGYQARICSNWGALGLWGNCISYNYGLHYRATGWSGEIDYFNLWDTGAANQMDLRNGTSAQVLRITNTYTSSTNWEAFVIDWQTTANTVRLGTEVGSGGGTARELQFIRGGVVKATIGANTTDHAQPVKLPSYTVSSLPSASTCGAGSMAFATDATSTTAYTTVSGGGSSQVLVISDGTNWIIH